jgi:hypothetical protein
LLTLIRAGLVPESDYIETPDWKGLLELCDSLSKKKLPYRFLAYDALSGFETMCQEHVCQESYRGDWSEKGFQSYQSGYKQSANEWLRFVTALDRIKKAGVNIILLAHTVIRTFKNPSGPDFDKYAVDLHEKVWGLTHKWADAILFGKFQTAVVTDKRHNTAMDKGKGVGDTTRLIHTERRDAWDAGNRFSMPEEITIPDKAIESFEAIFQHIPWR